MSVAAIVGFMLAIICVGVIDHVNFNQFKVRPEMSWQYAGIIVGLITSLFAACIFHPER